MLISSYMLRYLKGTQTLKNLIQEKGLTVMSVSARLVTAYELAIKVVSLSICKRRQADNVQPWWNVNVSQGLFFSAAPRADKQVPRSNRELTSVILHATLVEK